MSMMLDIILSVRALLPDCSYVAVMSSIFVYLILFYRLNRSKECTCCWFDCLRRSGIQSFCLQIRFQGLEGTILIIDYHFRTKRQTVYIII
jgi:hypothetical protein